MKPTLPNILACKDTKSGRKYYKANLCLGKGLYKQFSGINRDDLERRLQAYIAKLAAKESKEPWKAKPRQSFSKPLLAACGLYMHPASGRCQVAQNCQFYSHCLDLADALGWPGWQLKERKEL